MNLDIEGRVLLVEDRGDWRRRLTKYLEQEGYFFETARTYNEALDMLDKKPFDVVLVDLRLVDWDDTNFQGLDLLPRIDELREENGTQAIVVTAYPTPESVRTAFHDHEISDFFFKADFDPQRFKEVLRDTVTKAYEARDEILKTK